METASFEPLYDTTEAGISAEEGYRREVLHDFFVCCSSREASVISRREVLTGKAKFGISGDGKEVAQVAMAKAFHQGDFRSGYYRDQTLMFALGVPIEAYFAQLYADIENDPFSRGRQMISHFASPLIKDGYWTNHLDQYNTAADVSCTAGQVGRAVGLAMASSKYRKLPMDGGDFSHNGDEVVFCTIGDGSTSEGAFWESVNASCVLQVPVAFCVWDDGYSISVPKEFQTVKGSISEALAGFETTKDQAGMAIYRAKAWDYVSLCELFLHAIPKIRQSHEPALIHIEEMTQPLGHSTSGSHERYKTPERIAWEDERDCIEAMALWIVSSGLATREEVEHIREEAKIFARTAKRAAWEKAQKSVVKVSESLTNHLDHLENQGVEVDELARESRQLINTSISELLTLGRRAYQKALLRDPKIATPIRNWIDEQRTSLVTDLSAHLYTEDRWSALQVPVVPIEYDAEAPEINGFDILNQYFAHLFEERSNVFAFGEDVGMLGDVNQGFRGLQRRYGDERISDTGIREWSIIGQAIGMAMRGLRPIAEIQYIDYILYAIAPLSDDLASLSYRTAGIQKAPVIIRSRGHRLEGIWHSGSPMGMLLHILRGIYICVPRNMVQAAGMYQTAIQSHDPVLIIECLNGYRLKEKQPSNLGTYTVPYGVPEILREGSDLSVITYGSCVRPALQAAEQLSHFDIEVEVIDVQTLLPFDLEHRCVKSIEKTNRVLFLDEDVEGGASAFMMQQVLEKQKAYRHLDSAPQTLTAADHRPPYGENGDFVAKPNAEDIFELVYDLMNEVDPTSYPKN